jgi:predicted GNAT family acetyltransferase
MAYLNIAKSSPDHQNGVDVPFIFNVPDLSRTFVLTDSDEEIAMEFLNKRPVHTVVMASFINDNGLESPLNRGKFYGYRNANGLLEGVALIGHSTLIEARSEEALAAFAAIAKTSETPVNLIMSAGNDAERFWQYLSNGVTKPRLSCTELLFETAFPFMVRDCEWDVRLATAEESIPIAEAQAEVALIESGVCPLERDREGFLARVQRRIEQGRVFVVFQDGKLLFKADIIAESNDVIYLEGVYVAAEHRSKGIGSSCLAKLNLMLLERASNICLLSNVDHKGAHKCFGMAGFRKSDQCVTLFV